MENRTGKDTSCVGCSDERKLLGKGGDPTSLYFQLKNQAPPRGKWVVGVEPPRKEDRKRLKTNAKGSKQEEKGVDSTWGECASDRSEKKGVGLWKV